MLAPYRFERVQAIVLKGILGLCTGEFIRRKCCSGEFIRRKYCVGEFIRRYRLVQDFRM